MLQVSLYNLYPSFVTHPRLPYVLGCLHGREWLQCSTNAKNITLSMYKTQHLGEILQVSGADRKIIAAVWVSIIGRHRGHQIAYTLLGEYA